MWDRINNSVSKKHEESWIKVCEFIGDRTAFLLIESSNKPAVVKVTGGDRLKALLEDCPPFDFSVCGEKYEYLLCVNHHDYIVGAGLGGEWVRSLNSQTWIPISYREFFDIPRSFICTWQGKSLFFDCPFNNEGDKYPEVFQVYLLPEGHGTERTETWPLNHDKSIGCFGKIPTHQLVFDPTRRAQIDFSPIEAWGTAQGWW
jgi:hypothetical protein